MLGSSRLPARIATISGLASIALKSREPQDGQKPRETRFPLAPASSWYYARDLERRFRHANAGHISTAGGPLTITAMTVAHENRVSRIFIANCATGAPARNSIWHVRVL